MRVRSSRREAANRHALQVVSPPPMPDTPPGRRVQVVRKVRDADTYNSRPDVAITIDQLMGIYRRADRGEPLLQCDLFERLREFDGHLLGLFDGRHQAWVGSDWTMQTGGPDAGSVEAASTLEEHLRNNIGWREFCEHQAKALEYGYSGSEIVWDVIDGLWLPVRFVNVAHRRFAAPSWDRADEIALRNGDTLLDMVELEPGKWVVNRLEGRNPYMAGRMRTCAPWAIFKRWSNRDWQVFAELFGIPGAIGFYEAGASAQTRRALEDAIRLFGEEGFAVLEDTCEIVMKESVRSGDASSVFPAQWEKFEAQMSKAVNGGTLTTDPGTTGSYAQATTHADRAFSFARADAKRFEETVTRDLCTPFVVWNGFGGAKPCRPKFQIQREQSLLASSEILVNLATAFGPSFVVAWPQVAEVFGWRIPAPGEQSLAPPKPEPKAAPPGKPTAAERVANMLVELEERNPGSLERLFLSMGATKP